jgi:hypothetical protein
MPRLTQFFVFTLLLALLSGCVASVTPSPTDFQPILTPSGPETTPNSPRPYPSTLTVEMAEQGISAVIDAPSTITGLADVQAIITKHKQLARDAGLSFDHMAVKYVATEQRWFLVPVESGGTIAGWLEIADPTSQSGWRFGEQPTWDSRYSPSKDTYQYGLPALHDPANHFETGFANGFPVLIEVTTTGTPQYWNNIVEKSMMLIEGAVIPIETPIPTEIYQPRQVELVFAPDDVTVPDSCKVVPEATADNTLTLNGQPLPDGTVIDIYQNITSTTSGVYNQPTLLIAARAVAIEKLIPDPDMGWVDPYLLCYNVKLPSGDTMVIASIFDNTSQQGFQNTAVYELPGADVAGVTLDQTATQPTPIKVIRNSDFLALFTSGTIIGQQVLLPFAYDYPSTDRAIGENLWRGAIVAALKAGRLPPSGYFHSIYATPIGGEFVVPESLVP